MPESKYWERHFQNRLSRRRVLQGSAAGVVTLGLAACTSSSTESPTAAPAATVAQASSAVTPVAAAPSATAAPPAAKYGGTLRPEASTGKPPNMDIHGTATYSLHSFGAAVAMSRIVRTKVEPGTPPGARIVTGDLAESWTQPDENTYIFKLRQGVKFHNIAPVNGREFVADDVVWSYTRQIDKKVNAGYLAAVDKMEATDKYTLKITLKQPDSDFLLNIADSRNKIAAKEVVDLALPPVIGTGPWIHEKNGPDLEAFMVRNPDYFIKGIPYLDRVEFLRLPDNQTMVAGFRSGQLNIQGTGIDQAALDVIKKEIPNVQTYTAPGLGTGFELGFRTDKPPFNNINVRRAISKAIDRQVIVNTVYGAGELVPGFTLPGNDWILPQDELKKLLARDLAGAKKLLADAGITNLSFEMSVSNFGEQYVSGAELAAAQLKEAGIDAKLKLLAGTEYNQVIVARGEFDVYFAIAQPIGVTNADLDARFTTNGSRNIYKFSDPQLDTMIKQQAALGKDPDGRKKLLGDIQRRIIDNTVLVGLYSPTGGAAVAQPYVRNFQRFTSWAAGGEYDIWTRIWFDK